MDVTKEDADKRYALAYPMEVGSPAFAPIDVKKEKDVIHNAGKLHAKEQYDRIMEQVAVLKKQADSLMNRMAVSEVMHKCNITFKPVHGKIYFVYYDTIKEEHMLSMTNPNWKNNAWPSYIEHRMTVRLLGDSTWEEVIE
jgi:hypothetical protein